MHAQLRLVGLVCLARLRSAGFLPWLVFAAWLGIASSQEPVLLRSYGVCLVEQASWAWANVLLVLLLMAERRQPMRWGWLANLSLLLLLAIVQAVLPLLIDLARDRPHSLARLKDVAGFSLCWAPFAMTYWGLAHRPRGITVGMLLLAFALGCAHSVALRSSDPFHGVVSASVAVLAAVTWLQKHRK